MGLWGFIGNCKTGGVLQIVSGRRPLSDGNSADSTAYANGDEDGIKTVKIRTARYFFRAA
ncbi:MAG: hypothetical protein K2J73_05010 [Oscillospiraceae bacterium]|nr:hypothetical protein [Oscillospiraceae bacterium]